ncbi:MAG: putative basic amino acid antiporter YfcC [Tissierellia bacterium]|nr:putative basic amino acid antiporter YfcC [Tissierellia bacterium]
MSEQTAKIKEKKKFKVPHTYVIIFTIVLIMAILTYIIPAGEFDRIQDEATGRTVIDPASYHPVDQNPTTFFELWKAVPRGMVDAASIIFFMFIISGSFGVIQSTGAIEAFISRVALALQGKDKIMVPMIVFIFSIFGGTIGMAEEAMIFIPLGIVLSRALGYDAIVGTSMILLGCACGFTSGFMNSFTVGVAQGLAQLPLYSGIELRIVIWFVFVIFTSIFILRYGAKVKADPSKSAVYELEIAEKDTKVDLSNLKEMTKSHVFVMLTMLAGFIAIIYGVFKDGWYITEISAAFLAMGVFSGFFGKMGPSDVAKEFILGAKDIVFGALVVGIARGILMVMKDGMIMDTIVNALAILIQSLPRSISILGMYVVQVILSIIIPSGSGLAATTMPIMIPLSDVLEINRQVAVLTYQFGDGISNSFIPTAASCMGALSVAKISYEKWMKWSWPLIVGWLVLGGIFCLIGMAINYGPF